MIKPIPYDEWVEPEERVLYGEPDEGGYIPYDNLDDEIGYTLDGMDTWPKTITVTVNRRVEIPRGPLSECVIDRLLEHLMDEYGDPGENNTPKPSEEQLMAARRFVDVVCDGFDVWWHEPAEEILVDVQSWVRAHRSWRFTPDWLEKAK